MTVKGFLKGAWQFVSFLAVPQQGRHITEQAQSYHYDELKILVAKLIDRERAEGRNEPLSPEFVASELKISVADATWALNAVLTADRGTRS